MSQKARGHDGLAPLDREDLAASVLPGESPSTSRVLDLSRLRVLAEWVGREACTMT
jgi:hypothetical protein